MNIADLKLAERRILAACARGAVTRTERGLAIHRVWRDNLGPRDRMAFTANVTRPVRALIGYQLVALDGDHYRPTEAGGELVAQMEDK